jgi:hypothetical protein
MRGLQRLIIGLSTSGPWYVLALVTALGSFAILARIGTAFPDLAGGALPFDLQNTLSPGDVHAQLAGWTPAARRLYFVFSAVDWIFPLAAGLFQAATITFCLRQGLPRAYRWLTSRHLLPLLLLPTAADWLENILAVSVVASYPPGLPWLPVALVAAKQAKLASLALAQGLMIGLLVYTAGRWAFRRRGRPVPSP